MLRNITLLLAVTLWSSASLLLPKEVSADTSLSRAVIESLKNQVRLIPKNQSARPARPSDAMTPGDALATAKASMAQLRFNDGSLARVGEQAVFSFSPGTRTFALSNGTALVLIPPGRGTTRVRTPNAAAGIRGSALFVRYIPETDTTIVGALTNSGIEVFNEAASQRQELKAGNMAVITKDRIEKVYEFDLKTFYQTSDLVTGLNLTKSESTPSSDAAIAQVQAETSVALQAQSPIAGAQVLENPTFVQLPANPSQEFPRVDSRITITDETPISRQQNLNLPRNTIRNSIDARTLLEGGQIRDTQAPSGLPGRGNGNGGILPGRGNGNGGILPGRGNGNGGILPGQGNGNGGIFPGQGNGNGGIFPGQGNGNGGIFPGQGNGNGGNFPGQGNGNGGIFPGQGNGNGGNFPGQGNGNGGNFPGQGNGNGGNFPGQGNGNGGNFPGQGNGNGANGANRGGNPSTSPASSGGNNPVLIITPRIPNNLPTVGGNVPATVNIPTITPTPAQ